MSEPKITLIGLGAVGKSIGKMLCRVGGQLEVVGHDREPLVAKEAQKAGSVSRTHWNLLEACKGADVVVIATPLHTIRDIFQAITSELKPDCLIMDTAPLKVPVIEWADEILSDEVNFVGGNPILYERLPDEIPPAEDEPHSNPLKGCLFCLTPSVKAAPEGIHLATDLVRLLEAKPFFLDPFEHDGLVAGVDQLPLTMGLSLVHSLTEVASWREMRKLAGIQFEDTVRVLSQDPEALRDMLLLNRENVTRVIDSTLESLNQLRNMIQVQDKEQLQQLIESASAAYRHWLKDRGAGLWEKPQAPEIPTGGGFFGRMLGFRGGQDGRKDPLA